MSQPVLNVVHSLRDDEEMVNPDVPSLGPEASTLEKPKRESRPKTRYALPPDRLTTKAQLTVLRAFSAASEEGKRPVHYRTAAEVARMHRSTVSSANPYFVEVGFLTKVDGDLMPAPEVIAYKQAYDWNPQTAAIKLAPIVERSWFFGTLRPHLGFGAMPEEEAIQKLAEECGAPPGMADSLRMLVEYIEVCGIIEREGGTIKLANKGATLARTSPLETPTRQDRSYHEETPVEQVKPAIQSTTTGSTDGLRFSVNIKVDLVEMSSWQPDRIAAFFSGMAQVIAAKKGLNDQ